MPQDAGGPQVGEREPLQIQDRPLGCAYPPEIDNARGHLLGGLGVGIDHPNVPAGNDQHPPAVRVWHCCRQFP